MDIDKLYEAAEEYFKDESAFRSPCLCEDFVVDAFRAGALGLTTQPLADRLTDEEKENIKFMHAEAALWCKGVDTEDIEPLSHYHGRKVYLEFLFKRQFFEEEKGDGNAQGLQ